MYGRIVLKFIYFLQLFLFCEFGYSHSFNSTNISVDYELNLPEGKMILLLEAATHHFVPLAEIDTSKDAPDPNLYLKKITDFVAKNSPIKIDNIEVKPIGVELLFSPELEYIGEANSYPLLFALLKCEYSVVKIPKKIEFEWNIFPIIPSFVTGDLLKDMLHERPEVTAQIIIKDKHDEERYDFFTMKENEPKYTWHSGYFKGAPKSLKKLPVYVEKESQLKFSVSLLFSFIMIFILISVYIFSNSKVKIYNFLWLLVFILILGFYLKDKEYVVVNAKNIFGKDRRNISNNEVEELFKSLLSNVYRSFDYNNEDDIYFSLYQSVRGDLLEKVFSEIYKSLIFREEGGAISKVKKIEFDSIKITKLSNNYPSYEIVSDWRVQGVVKHYKHIHVRENKYKAKFNMIKISDYDDKASTIFNNKNVSYKENSRDVDKNNLEGNSWRISSMELLENKRIISNKEKKEKEELRKVLEQMEIDDSIINDNLDSPR